MVKSVSYFTIHGVYYMGVGGLSRDEATRWLALRPQYMREVFCKAEPDEEIIDVEPYPLPTFKGYTVDMRWREFRKATLGEMIEFIPFHSPKGKKLFAELKSFAEKVILF